MFGVRLNLNNLQSVWAAFNFRFRLVINKVLYFFNQNPILSGYDQQKLDYNTKIVCMDRESTLRLANQCVNDKDKDQNEKIALNRFEKSSDDIYHF